MGLKRQGVYLLLDRREPCTDIGGVTCSVLCVFDGRIIKPLMGEELEGRETVSGYIYI